MSFIHHVISSHNVIRYYLETINNICDDTFNCGANFFSDMNDWITTSDLFHIEGKIRSMLQGELVVFMF